MGIGMGLARCLDLSGSVLVCNYLPDKCLFIIKSGEETSTDRRMDETSNLLG